MLRQKLLAAINLGDMLQIETDYYTAYVFKPNNPMIDNPMVRVIRLFHADEVNYKTYIKHWPWRVAHHQAQLSAGPVEMRIMSLNAVLPRRYYAQDIFIVSDAEARVIRTAWNWQYEGTEHACRPEEVL